MGKAIIVDGLSVPNPLCTVTFVSGPEEAALRDYLAANSTINDTEKDALTAFVKGLINANLWEKVKYFYPMLGGSVSDMILDVVNPSTEDILSNAGNTGLSVVNRTLVANNRPNNQTSLGYRAKSLDSTKIGFVASGHCDEQIGGSQQFYFNAGSAKYIGILLQANSGYCYPAINYGGQVYLNQSYYAVLERDLFGYVKEGTASLYLGSTLQTSSPVTAVGAPYDTYGILANTRSSDYYYEFLAITEGMDSDDWAVFYPLLTTFLTAVGRRQ